MFLFESKVFEVQDFITIKKELYYLSNDLVFKNKELTKLVQLPYKVNNIIAFLYDNNESEVFFKDIRIKFLNEGNLGFSYLSLFTLSDALCFGSYFRFDNELGIVFEKKGFYNLQTKKKEITIENTLTSSYYYNNKEILILIDKNKSLSAHQLPKGNKLWQFNTNQFGTFQDEYKNPKEVEIRKFIGVWNNELIISCSNSLILALDIETGKIIRHWQKIENRKSIIFKGVQEGNIPDSRHFKLEKEANILFSIAGEHYVEINLLTSEIIVINILEKLQKNNIIRARYSFDYSFDETHIYTIGELDRRKLNLDWIPQCIMAINRKTFEIDWHYVFEKDGVNNDIPQLAGNKLFQLSSENNLYIFEKENLPSS